jgi:hypothetical protein
LWIIHFALCPGLALMGILFLPASEDGFSVEALKEATNTLPTISFYFTIHT